MFRHIRPYYPDSTISRPICEVKQGQVWLVLAWGTSWEVQMLYIFYFFFLLLLLVLLACVLISPIMQACRGLVDCAGRQAYPKLCSIEQVIRWRCRSWQHDKARYIPRVRSGTTTPLWRR